MMMDIDQNTSSTADSILIEGHLSSPDLISSMGAKNVQRSSHRPSALHIKTKTHSIKRSLDQSTTNTELDSPTTMLASDMTAGFHIESSVQDKVPTPPKRSFFQRTMTDSSSSYFNTEDIENHQPPPPPPPFLRHHSRKITSHDYTTQQAQQQAPLPFRKPFANLATSRAGSSSSLISSASASTVSSTNSMSTLSSIAKPPSLISSSATSSDQQIPQANNFNIYNDTQKQTACQEQQEDAHQTPILQRRTMRRAFTTNGSNFFSNRNASMINGSLFQPAAMSMAMHDLEEAETTLDALCVPSPIAERLTPNTENLIRLSNEEHELDDDSNNHNNDFFNDKHNNNKNNETKHHHNKNNDYHDGNVHEDGDHDLNLMIDNDDDDVDSPSLKREVGSPIQQRISSKIKAARSKVRRTHSMFQNPQDYFASDKMATSAINRISTNMTALKFNDSDSNNHYSNGNNNNNNGQRHNINSAYADHDAELSRRSNSTLPQTNIKTITDSKNLIPRIDVDELVNILDGKYSRSFDEVIIIDCRFEYEFEGGHIDGAINVSSQSDLENEFLSNDKLNTELPNPNRRLLIFHCEFSSYRGPLMANHLRKSDRLINADNYPNLHYPDILILEGGYKNFFDLQSHRCYPKCYVQMNDSQHQHSCKIQMDRVRRDSKLQSSRSLKKAKSFHLGFPNSAKLHMRSRSQTILHTTTSSSLSSLTTAAAASTTTLTSPTASGRPASFQRTRASSSFLNFSSSYSSKNHTMKFGQRSSINSVSSGTTLESDEDAESDLLSAYLSMGSNNNSNNNSNSLSNRNSSNITCDNISDFFENQAHNTLSSFLEQGHNNSKDFKFPLKMKSSNQSLFGGSTTQQPSQQQQQQQQPQQPTKQHNNSLRFSDVVKEHQDTPFISHKKQKSSTYLYRTNTQPNLRF